MQTAPPSIDAVRFSIMCHPARESTARELADLLGHPNVRLVMADLNVKSTLDTLGRALAPDDTECEYEVVLNDDVTPSAYFLDHLASILPAVNNHNMIALFAPSHGQTASLARVLWQINGPGLFPVIDAYAPSTGMVISREVASAASKYLRSQFSLGSWRPDDRILHEFAVKEGLKKLVAVPNLIDHDRAKTRSLLGHDMPGLRRSMAFVDDTSYAIPVSWRIVEDASVEVVAPHLHWNGLTEVFIRWSRQDGSQMCGVHDLLADHKNVRAEPAIANNAPLAAPTITSLGLCDCTTVIRNYAYRIGIASRLVADRTGGGYGLEASILRSAASGSLRKYHDRFEVAREEEQFLGVIRWAWNAGGQLNV